MSDISCICVGRDPKAKIINKIKYLAKNMKPSITMLKQRFANRSDLNSLEDNIKNQFGCCPTIEFIEHHRAHLASAFFSSPFEESTLISIDGSGDFSTIMIGKGVGNKIEILESQDFPVSMGLFYSAFTQFLGFPYYGDEYKVMGLASYGKPQYANQFEDLIKYDKENLFLLNLDYY